MGNYSIIQGLHCQEASYTNKYHKTISGFHYNGTSDSNFKYVALMCPNCFSYHKVKLRNSISIDTYPCDEFPKVVSWDKIFGVSTVKLFAEKCSSCGEEDIKYILIDSNLADAICILNRNGFKTKYSCESHLITVNDDDDTPNSCYIYDGMYIMFEGNSILEYVNLLSDSWFVDYTDMKMFGNVVIRTDYSRSDLEKINKLLDLYNFIDAVVSSFKIYRSEYSLKESILESIDSDKIAKRSQNVVIIDEFW